MKLKEFAESKNISLTKAKKLCNEILNTIPSSLTEDQISLLDAHLMSAAKALNSSTEEKIDEKESLIAPSGLTTHSPTEIDQKVINIVGIRTLKELLIQYLSAAKSQLEAEKFKADSLVFQAEQTFYNDLANYQKNAHQESLNRMAKTSQIWNSEGLKNDDNEDELDLNKELFELMESFGL